MRRARERPDERPDEREVDVVVVGAGVAGLSVANRIATTTSLRVLVVSAGAGSTGWAQGGVAAAVGPGDTAELHADDTLTAGAGACDPAAVAGLTAEGPARVADLMAAGARFDHTDGRLRLGREGGHGRRRILHADGDATGREVARALEQQARELGVPWLDSRVTGVLVRRGRAVGVQAGGLRVHARAVVLATGGLGHAYPLTTNPAGVTGDGLALALLAGATLADVEFVQFHPTALWTGASRGQVPLVTEALRGEGAVLRDAAGAPLMTGRHPLADLAPRDVVARGVYDAMRRDHRPHVLLDTTPVTDLGGRFPTVAAACRAHDVDLRSIPVAPAEHYLCGGVATDLSGATDVPGLYAVGEVAATGVHGANRLASNSLLEGLVWGHRLARRLAVEVPAAGPRGGEPVLRVLEPATACSVRARELLGSAAGLVRDGDTLDGARRELLETTSTEVAWLVAASVVGAAAARRESRGCHLRADEPETRTSWRRRVAVRLDDDGVPHAAGAPQVRAA